MAKDKTVYVCSNCGQDSPKWVGKCPSCGEWNTYVEEIVRKEVANKRPTSGIETPKAKPISLCDIVTSDEPRIDLKDEELNRVLGGGLVPGSLVLIGGEPGIGGDQRLDRFGRGGSGVVGGEIVAGHARPS